MIADKWCRHVPPFLLDAMKSTSQPPVFFIGSGFGKEAVEPLKTGGELVEAVRAELGIPYAGEGLAEMLQYLLNHYIGSRGLLLEWLKKELADGVAVPGGAHFLLLRLPVTEFLTTNYDSLLEAAALSEKIPLTPIYDPLSWPAGAIPAQKHLGHIHGAFSHTATVVATTDDYIDRYTRGDAWQDILARYLRERMVVFVGYSLRDFTTWTSYISMRLRWARSAPPHVLVSPDGEHVARYWQAYGIKHVPMTAGKFLMALHILLGTLPDDAGLAVAAYAACHGRSMDEASTELAKLGRRQHDPDVKTTITRVLMRASR